MNIHNWKDILVTVPFWVAGILLLSILKWLYPDFVLGATILLCVWFASGFTIVRENERAVKILLGWPYAIAENGPTWIPYFPHRIRRYTTGVVEIDGFKRAGVVTRAGKAPGDDVHEYGSVNIGVDPSFRFRWPTNDADLITCVKMLPSPEDGDALRDIFEEQLLDDIRNVGGQKVWVELARERKTFAEAVSSALREKAKDSSGNPTEGNLIVDSKILDPTVAISHLDIPLDIINALHSEERERRIGEGTVVKADRERQRLELEGQGAAKAHKMMLDAIGDTPESIRKQALLTLEQMAKGQATTIFPIPTDVMQALSGVLSNPNVATATPGTLMQIFRSLSEHQKKKVSRWIQTELAPKGGA